MNTETMTKTVESLQIALQNASARQTNSPSSPSTSRSRTLAKSPKRDQSLADTLDMTIQEEIEISQLVGAYNVFPCVFLSLLSHLFYLCHHDTCSLSQ